MSNQTQRHIAYCLKNAEACEQAGMQNCAFDWYREAASAALSKEP